MKELKDLYEKRKQDIKSRLENFRNLPEEKYMEEFIFCTLTPQSNAMKCWSAVEEIRNHRSIDLKSLSEILKTKTRFHNNKSRYIIENLKNWEKIKSRISKEKDITSLRNWLNENVMGYGLKESSHFLRNIGKSGNQIAILDRHILRNMKSVGIIEEERIKNEKNYLEIEEKFLEFAESLGILPDELDLLLWSKENGEIFK